MSQNESKAFFDHILATLQHSAKGPETLISTSRKLLSDLSAPSTKDEEWRFISLKELYKSTFTAPVSDKSTFPSALYLSESAQSRVVFVNGVFSPELSDLSALGDGVIAGIWSTLSKEHKALFEEDFGQHLLTENDAFYVLSNACFTDAFVLSIPADTKIEHPIVVHHHVNAQGTGVVQTPRLLVKAGRYCKAVIVEDFSGVNDAAYFTLAVSELSLKEGAHVTHTKVQREGLQAFHINRTGATQHKHSHYESYSIQLGAKLSRNDNQAIMAEQECQCTLDGLVLMNGSRVSDTHTVMDHRQPHCNSHQLHKCIVDEKGHSVFNGKIFVRQAAQKTDSFQENRNIILSRDAKVDTKPQLEIFADDVKCSHGATIGQLSDEEAFYLRSRGMDERTAKEILAYAFALEVIENIPVASLRDQLSHAVSKFTHAELILQEA